MKYFTIKELTASDTAKAKGIDNTPSLEIQKNITILIEECLDPIREKYGKPINVTSGYRSPALNKAVGGVGNSQHLKGEAADIVGKNPTETKKIFLIAKELGVYDQLLYESNSKGSVWVHISHIKSDRHQCIDNYTVK